MLIRPWYSLTEYANLTGLSRETVRKHADTGVLKTEKMGKRRVITLAYLQSEYPDLWRSLVLAAELRALSKDDNELVAVPNKRQQMPTNARKMSLLG